MTIKLKLYLGRKIVDSIQHNVNISPMIIKDLIEISNSKYNDIEMNVPLKSLEKYVGVSNVGDVMKIKPDDIIEDIKSIDDRANKKISFKMNRNLFVKDAIENCMVPELNEDKKMIVVEYSSPNVAKPFHLGHLRSTIIGNFLANLNKYFKRNVIKLNYLGDWGTQFGYVKVGVDELKYTDESIRENPLKLLYESYVYANKLAEKDPRISERARTEFAKLEKGSIEDTNKWSTYLHYTIQELNYMYDRLGVTFDEYNYESMYNAKHVKKILEDLHKRNIVQRDEDGKQIVKIRDRNVTLVKSDGSTLYLTRDIAAAIDRYERYRFDSMYYVVDNAQTDHFNALKWILHEMDQSWAHRLHHIKFGRIRGMSTRKGTAVFLSDILNEMRELMVERQIKSPTTKAPITDTSTSDILGVSCMIINDLKQRRQKDYTFSWDSILQVQGDSGLKLQYTHCRLNSLIEKAGIHPANECLPELLTQPEVTLLATELGKFNDAVNKSYEQLESCVLVAYLFQLCNQISRTLKVLRVKDEDPDIAAQRLKLFVSAKEVLREGMIILGIRPLDKM